MHSTIHATHLMAYNANVDQISRVDLMQTRHQAAFGNASLSSVG
ncbi:hypothetical protein TGAM01_v202628 [Trichoderma gamsii]|uniref:Uncharacterized protein n=1 Tax=Trichoderma gamsii TaxID=398673 RepID=A0A2P4ZWY1_9HYPO|nr:hypothetical protein TGAM01_v202628 [Trichoderma gamsii]PON28781.1 hypothetical protein TGAM01_v202628 [Trichoderma gamsii]